MLKERSLKILFNIKKPIVYEGLLFILNQSKPAILVEIHDLAQKLSLVSCLQEHMNSWKANPQHFTALAAGLELLGLLGEEGDVEYIASFLYHSSDSVKSAAVISLKKIESPVCITFLFAPLKLANEKQALDILDLIGTYCEEKHILPLLYLMKESSVVAKSKILEIISTFPAEQVVKVVKMNVDKDDRDLCLAALTLFESSGMIEEARYLRDKFQITDTIDPATAGAAAQLGVEIKAMGDFVLVALAGVLDVYSLPTLSQITEKLIVTGHTNLLLICNRLERADNESIKQLDHLAQKIKLFGGVLKLIGLTVVDKSVKDDLLHHPEEFDDIRSAVLSFTTKIKEHLMSLNPDMVPPGKRVEVKTRGGTRAAVRSSVVTCYDERKITLKWFSQGPDDIFKEGLSPMVKLVLVYNNSVMEFEAEVIDQVFFPDPHIVLLKPRMGRKIDHRRHVRIALDVPVSFYHVIDSSKIRKDLKGYCKNISVGGMLLTTEEYIPTNGLIVAMFENDPVFSGKRVMGRVVKCYQASEAEGVCLEYGIEFQKLGETMTQILSRFVFDSVSTTQMV